MVDKMNGALMIFAIAVVFIVLGWLAWNAPVVQEGVIMSQPQTFVPYDDDDDDEIDIDLHFGDSKHKKMQKYIKKDSAKGPKAYSPSKSKSSFSSSKSSSKSSKR